MYYCDIVLKPAASTNNDIYLVSSLPGHADIYLYPRAEVSYDIIVRRQRYDTLVAVESGVFAALDGLAALVLTTNSALETDINMTGAAQLVINVLAALELDIDMIGASQLVIATLAALELDIDMIGSAALVLAIVARLSAEIRMQGTAELVIATLAALELDTDMLGQAELVIATLSELSIEGDTFEPYLLYYFGRARTHDAIAKKKKKRHC